ncbi:type VI secretion system membrane subunit TssM [Pseudomonas sp. D47]|uniref:type VI secretion system membrane subunit TssM n=1 Tax=Pseudomonas sp. D47 TaxID=3159447 RepID=UPI00387B386F
MRRFFKTLATVLRQTWAWSLLLVLILALFVWWAGPLLAVDDYKFWDSSTSRLLTISGLFLCWGLLIVFANWRNSLRKQSDENSEEGKRNIDLTEIITEEQRTLRRRFKEAVLTVQRSSLYGGHSQHSRKDLPWYLMLGPQSSGKTSLLENSGLNFPLNPRNTRQTSSEKHLGCDWYFAEHGVVLDTAGRFLTQDAHQVDAHAWRTLLGLLRQRRRNRPLNGVLINLPIELLQGGHQDQLAELAGQVHARLQEIHHQLRSDVPIYLVLSKADRVVGFDEFFDSLSREENQQVLGVTFRKGRDGNDEHVLREELEALLLRLNSQVLTRVHQERDTQRRGLILDFPHRLGMIGSPLCTFVNSAFSSNRYRHTSALRGFYLTSAPHAVGSAIPVGHAEQSLAGVTAGASQFNPGRQAPSRVEGRSRFIHHLFSQVIFPEAAMAGLDQQEGQRIQWRQRALYAGALGCLVLFGVLWASGFSANHEHIEQLRGLSQQLTREHSTLRAQDDAKAALTVLDRSYAATQVFPSPQERSLYERSGLYQGQKANPPLYDTYLRELDKQLLPRIAQLLEGQVRANLNNRERLLGSLRAYLMLNLRERRDAALLSEWIAADWSLRYPGNAAVQNGLNSHLKRLLEQPFVYPLNDALVAQARRALRGESLATVVYRILRDQAQSLPVYRLGEHMGPQGALFTGTGHTIPGFYTQQGYNQFFLGKGTGLVDEILQDNWVLGEGSSMSVMDLRRLMVELEQLYFRDYTNYWGEAVNQVALQPLTDAAQGAEMTAGLTSANSPLLQLLQEIRDNTLFPALTESLGEVADAAKATGALGKVATAAAEKAQASLAKSLPDTAKKALQRRFETLHRLLDDNNGPSMELAQALQALHGLQEQLTSLARSGQPDQAAFELAKARMSNQRDGLSTLRNTAARLPQPVNGWLGRLAEDSWVLVLDEAYQFLNQRYKNELYSVYAESINQRYPFHAHSTSDVAITDFREFFKAQGVADSFFNNYLKPFVSGDASNYHVRTVDGRGLPISSALLQQMRTMQVIRRSFFAQNPAEPTVLFKLEPYSLDSNLSRVEFRLGDQQLEYRHGPIVPVAFKWPNEVDDGRASLVLDDLSGRRVSIQKSTGPWSLFRLMDLMQTEYHSGRDVLMLKANVSNRRANFLLLSQRSPSPFELGELRSFNLPEAL